jgi:hypothetical protein
MIPGVGGVIGILVILIAAQVARDAQGLWLPDRLRRRNLPARRLQQAASYIQPVMDVLDRHSRERMPYLVSTRAARSLIAITLIAAGLAMMIFGFVPILPPLLGLPVLFFAIALTTRDGAFALAGYFLLLPPIIVAVTTGGGQQG